MSQRDSNETGQSHNERISPEAPRHEEVVSPLITEDYGTAKAIALLEMLATLEGWGVTAITKVDTYSRYVVEFQAVRRDAGLTELPPSMAFEPVI